MKFIRVLMRLHELIFIMPISQATAPNKKHKCVFNPSLKRAVREREQWNSCFKLE